MVPVVEIGRVTDVCVATVCGDQLKVAVWAGDEPGGGEVIDVVLVSVAVVEYLNTGSVGDKLLNVVGGEEREFAAIVGGIELKVKIFVHIVVIVGRLPSPVGN